MPSQEKGVLGHITERTKNMKLLQYGDAKATNPSAHGSAKAGTMCSWDLDSKGSGSYKGIVPIKLSSNEVRNTAISVTSQAQTTQTGATRLLLKVDVPYAAHPVDSATGVLREYGAISAHIVLTLPKRATQDLGGSNGADETTLARRQVDLVMGLLLDMIPSQLAKSGNWPYAMLGYTISDATTEALLGRILAVPTRGTVDNAIGNNAILLPDQLRVGRSGVIKETFIDGDTPNAEAEVFQIPGYAKVSVTADGVACLDLTENTASDDNAFYGPRSIITRAIAGLSPLEPEAIIAPPTLVCNEVNN